MIAAYKVCKDYGIKVKLVGVDVDPIAIMITRSRLIEEHVGNNAQHIILGNPLLTVSNSQKSTKAFSMALSGRYYNSDLAIDISESYDVVIGNPPWEKIRFEEKKFLSHYMDIHLIASKKNRENVVNNALETNQKFYRSILEDYKIAKEHWELVSRNTSICFDESRMEEWTFENADMSDAVMHKAKKYVDNWEKMKRNHIGCLFWGPVGTGKSYVAGCIANDLLKREVTVKMTNFNTIIDDIFPLADKTEYINALASYQLLIIDDLGVERNSEYALGIIFSVIDRRIRSGRPLIITTNLPLKEIKSETMLDKRRIYDRILEMCTPMYVGGTSKREAIASMKMEKAKTLLNTNRGEEKCE